MKKFLKLIIIFSLLFFIFDKLFYVFLIFSPQEETDKRLEEVINGKINKDLIILGSSRGARNIIASQIEDSLNISAFNLSYPGSDITFHEFLLESLLKFNKAPKTILLAVDEPFELLQDESLNFRFDRLYPLSRYRYINNELIERGEKTLLSKYLILARINRQNLDIRDQRFGKLDSIGENGSMPISIQKEQKVFDEKIVKIYNDSLDNYQSYYELENKVKAFKNFQVLCDANKIDLIIVFSPNYYKHSSIVEKRLKELSLDNVSFLVYDTENPIYYNTEFFYDLSHLRENGAIIFTNEIIGFLKKEYL